MKSRAKEPHSEHSQKGEPSRQAAKGSSSVSKLKRDRVRQLITSTVSRNVTELMERRGYTQMDLATRSGLSQKTVSNVVTGASAARIDNLDMIAAALEVPAWHLLVYPRPSQGQGDERFPEATD